MRVLIIGSGAREHALTWAFSRSKRISELCVAPGNAGTGELAKNLPDIDPLDTSAIIRTCRECKITVVFIGPEAPLAAGLVDELEAEGIPAIGPGRSAARLETSKAFAKSFMQRNGVPTAGYREFSESEGFDSYIKTVNGRIVLKKSGLAGGKGVLETSDKDEALSFGRKVLKDDHLVVEEFLSGYEISVFTLLDGNSYLMLPHCADFKKAGEGDTGPNTGGMGAICPVPWVENDLVEDIRREIIEPTFDGIRQEGLLYRGVLYFGLMITENGPRVLEYNVRLGDPETQVLLPSIRSDFGDLTDSILEGNLSSFPLSLSDKSFIGVVVASKGYPGKYEKGKQVKALPSVSEKEALLFHASTQLDDQNNIITGGGRCFTVVGRGTNYVKANQHAYRNAEQIVFDGAWFRSDIGQKFFMEG
ncbi:MAG: phosphoribosylamine--glycine ligase [Spirochaetales bacterium]|nr:phosphoribosylamine--glycine ligase [Spirochaetales bacterium]MCF7938635.1 phosphoribosylamine--glycine ligase [Spirochaetales bacterium]